MARDFKEGSNYVISVATHFEGKFVGYEPDDRGNRCAVFNTGGEGRHGIHQRKVPVHNIVESVPKKY